MLLFNPNLLNPAVQTPAPQAATASQAATAEEERFLEVLRRCNSETRQQQSSSADDQLKLKRNQRSKLSMALKNKVFKKFDPLSNHTTYQS